MNLLVQNNYLHSDLGRFACAIGRAGLTTNKIEGDHKTPVGEFKFQKIYYRKDKLGENFFSKYLLRSLKKMMVGVMIQKANYTINMFNFLLMQVLRNYSEMMIFMICYV